MGEAMRDRINAALKAAQDDGNKRRCATLRLVQTAVKDREAAARENGKDGVSEHDVIEILQKMIHQRKAPLLNLKAVGSSIWPNRNVLNRKLFANFCPLN